MQSETCDVIVVGAGPSGLACATVCADAGLHVTLVDRIGFGGQLMNVPVGYSAVGQEMTMGPDSAGSLALEMTQSGVSCQLMEPEKIRLDADSRWPWRLEWPTAVMSGRFLVAATGATPTELDVDGAALLHHKGISYCAPCDGPLYAGRKVALIADDQWALAEALSLADVVSEVVVIARDWSRDDWDQWRHELLNRSNVTALDGQVVGVSGGNEGHVGGIVVDRGACVETVPVDAVFVSLGAEPASSLFDQFAELDSSGRIIVNADLEASTAGMFAIGDVRAGSALNAEAALSDGRAVAALAIARLSDVEKLSPGATYRY